MSFLKKVFVVIPHWNHKEVLGDCLLSLRKIKYPNYEIIVSDNGSADDSQSFVQKNFPEVSLLENNKNLGFAGGCNRGIKCALERGADYILLLNNDTVVAPDFLNRLVEAAEKDRKTGIVGSKIYYYDQPQKIWFGGGDFINWRASGKHRFWQRKDSSKLSGAIKSDFITGCVFLIKKEVFQDIGRFYEPYFLTIEDLDFSWHAQKAGWKIKVDLDSRVWHKVSSSRDGEFSFSNGYYGTRNRLFFAFQRTRNFVGGSIFLFLIIPARIIQWTLSGHFPMVKGIISGCFDFLRGKLGPRK
jgi:hypothetical protein